MRICSARGSTMIEVCLLTVAISLGMAAGLRVFGLSTARAVANGTAVLDGNGQNGDSDRVRLPAPEGSEKAPIRKP